MAYEETELGRSAEIPPPASEPVRKAKTPALTEDEEEELLEEIRERFDYATNEWADIREEASKDMRFVSGDPWDPKMRKAREDAKRPVVSPDEISQYINQVVNDVRANPRGVKFSPSGDGASDKTAEFYGNKAREIEYRSKGSLIFTTAFENAVQRGYGFCRVNTRYESPRSFNQEIWLEPFMNPDLVTPDPDALMPDSSDMGYCFVAEWLPIRDFKKEHPRARVVDFSDQISRRASSWFRGDKVQRAEYWKVKSRKRKLLLLRPPPPKPPTGSILNLNAAPPLEPIAVFEDELPKEARARLTDADVLRERDEDDQEVCQYLTNGVEILKVTPWAGKYIPIVSCYGKVLWLEIEGKGMRRVILSMVRLARDPQMLYAYIRTCQAEAVGGVPRNSWIGYKGQFKGQEDDWKKANHEPIAYLEANAKTPATGEQLLPLPQRQPWDPPLANLDMVAESMRRAVQAAMATNFLPTQAQRRNEKSGRALDKMDQAAQRGSFHFVDHYNAMIEQVGIIEEDLMDKIYDTAREVGIRKQDETAEIVKINVKGAISTKGRHLTTVSTGPNHDSQREAAGDFAESLMNTPFAPLVADLIVKLRQLGPLGDEMAERLTPPQFRKPKDGQIDPAQLQQMLAMMQQENEQLKATLEGIAIELKAKRFEIESKERIALEEIASRERQAGVKAETDVGTTVLKTDSSEAIARMEAQIELLKIRVDERQAELDRAHAETLAERQHQQALEAGKQGIAGQMAVQASKPQPANGNGGGA